MSDSYNAYKFTMVRRLKEKAAPLAKPLSIVAFIISVIVAAYWFMPIPSPGKAIALLGAVAVFIALRGEMREIHRSEKVAWILIVFALLYVEIRAIDKDRQKHDEEQAQTRTDEKDAFKSIADGITTSISNNQQAFDATMRRMEGLAELAGESIKTMTGADSFCYMLIGPNGAPVFVQQGKYPLYNVGARIVDMVKFRQVIQQGNQPDFRSDLFLQPGDLAVGKTWIDFGLAIPFSSQERQDFNIFMTAKNGAWTEILRLRKVDGAWERAMQVVSVAPGGGRNKMIHHIVKEEISKKFPKDDLINDTDWTPTQISR